jgi:hypothetical protein
LASDADLVAMKIEAIAGRLRALAYFEDAEKEPMPEMLVPFDWQETRRFFAAEAARLLAAESS